MSKPAVLVEPILVGRAKELEELQTYLNSAVEGNGKTVFVSGEAGSGKTRLAREFLKAALRRGVAVMAGWCLSDAQVPYFPFMEAFNNYYTALGEGETRLLQPQAELEIGTPAQVGIENGELEITSWLGGPKPTEKPGKPQAISPQAWKDQVFVAVSKTLHTIAGQSPLVLFIEDLQWADSASLALLHYVSRAIHDSERVLVLATYRSEELTADAEGHPHPLMETMRLMDREELLKEVKLSSLDQLEVSKMAENMIGGKLQQELAGKLTAESRGNPLFVVESLRMLQEHKGLVQKNGEWRLAINELGIPSRIKDIILRRLSRLENAQRRVLDAASVIGEEFDVDLLSTVLGYDCLDVLETLNLIARSTSIVLDAGDCYRFDHSRSREVLYDELSSSLRKGYHNRIAEKLERIKSTTLPLSDLAYHYAQAGNKDKAVKFSLAAGKDELAKWSNMQAIQHFHYVLQNVPEGYAEEKGTALEGLGDAYTANCMYGEAIKTFDELAASETGAVRLRAFRKAMDAAYFKGDKPDLLLEYAKKAEELAAYDRLEMARILDDRGRAFGYVGRGDPGMDLADYDAALQVFEEENSVADVAEALWRSGSVCIYFQDLWEKGLGKLLRSAAIFRELGDVRREITVTLYTGLSLSGIGLLTEARREYLKVLKTGEKLGAFDELASASSFLSMSYEREGELAESVSQTLKAFEYSKKTDRIGSGSAHLFALVRLYSKLGELKKADECFEKMSKLPPEVLSQVLLAPIIIQSRGVYFAAKDRWQESNQVFEILLQNIPTYHIMPGREITLRRDYAWALEKQGRMEEARVQGYMAQKLLEQAEERFAHANVQFGLMVPRRIQVGEEFDMRLDLVNVGRKPCTVGKVAGVVPPEFTVVSLPSSCSRRDDDLEIKEKNIDPFQVKTFTLNLNTSKIGSYDLNPVVSYVDDLGNVKTFKLDPITIIVESAKPAYKVLPGRVTTGTEGLDRLLLGGIPEGYAVALTAPSLEERQKITENYVNAGAKEGQTTFCLTTEPKYAKSLAEEKPSSVYLFVCNPRSDLIAKDLLNVYPIKGIDSLNEIDIALAKAFRRINASNVTPRRACIEIVSDVLLQHHAVITRKWLSGLIQDLKSKGFTILGVIDPLISPEEVPAISGLFDGEIRLAEKETANGRSQTLRILRLQGQNYLKDEMIIA